MKGFTKYPALVALVLLAANPAHADGLPVKKYLPIALAAEAAEAAIATCAAQGYFVSASVVDRDGVVRLTLLGDGAGMVSVSSSYRKAYTAAAFGRPTSAREKRDQELALANPPQPSRPPIDPILMNLAGGQPIKIGNDVLAGLGIGGADSSEKDDACALAGIAKIQERLK